jgi:hypothetical protein
MLPNRSWSGDLGRAPGEREKGRGSRRQGDACARSWEQPCSSHGRPSWKLGHMSKISPWTHNCAYSPSRGYSPCIRHSHGTPGPIGSRSGPAGHCRSARAASHITRAQVAFPDINPWASVAERPMCSRLVRQPEHISCLHHHSLTATNSLNQLPTRRRRGRSPRMWRVRQRSE